MSGINQNPNVTDHISTPTTGVIGPEALPSARVQHLTTIGTEFKFDSTIRVEAFVRSLSEIIRSAEGYCDVVDEQAYVLYIRFLTLSVEKLPFHPGFKNLEPAIKNDIKSKAGDILSKADSLKAKLLLKFTAEHEKYLLELNIRQKVREAEEEKLKELDKERDDLKIQREELEKRLEELKLEKRRVECRWTEVKRERKELIAKRKQDQNNLADKTMTDRVSTPTETKNIVEDSDEDNENDAGNDEVPGSGGGGDN